MGASQADPPNPLPWFLRESPYQSMEPTLQRHSPTPPHRAQLTVPDIPYFQFFLCGERAQADLSRSLCLGSLQSGKRRMPEIGSGEIAQQ